MHSFSLFAQTDAIATMVGLVLPALYPPCHCFVDCGPIYIHSKECINMLEVTVHGMVTCRWMEGTCPYDCDDDHDNRKYIIRLNIDLPSDNVCETKYDVPKDVATEVLAGMFAHNLDKALYVTVTKDAVTVVELLGLQSIWDDELSIMVDLCGVQNIKWPTKLNPGVRQLCEDLTEYIQFNTRLTCKVPLLKGIESQLLLEPDADLACAYKMPPDFEEVILQVCQITETIGVLASEAEGVIQDSYNLSRNKATEVLVFMCSDTDHMKQTSADTYTSIIGYALKGPSLPVAQMRGMLEQILEKTQESEVRILCTCSDGQWWPLCSCNNTGAPLTLLELEKRSWETASKLGMKGIIEKLACISSVNIEHLTSLSVPQNSSEILTGNIAIKRLKLENYTVTSNHEHNVAYSNITLSNVCITDEDMSTAKYGSNLQGKVCGILPDEKNILDTLPIDYLDECGSSGNFNFGTDDLNSFLWSNEVGILKEIVNDFKTIDLQWNDIEEEGLLMSILSNTGKLFGASHLIENIPA